MNSVEMEVYSEDDDGYDSSSSISQPESSQENIPPTSSAAPTHLVVKRAGSETYQGPSKRNKPIPGPLERKALEALEKKIFRGKALNVTPFETFTAAEDQWADELNAKEEVTIPEEELQKLFAAIPLEEKEEKDELQEIVTASTSLGPG